MRVQIERVLLPLASVMCFATPHTLLGEAVGLAIADSNNPVSADTLRQHAWKLLPLSHVPQVYRNTVLLHLFPFNQCLNLTFTITHEFGRCLCPSRRCPARGLVSCSGHSLRQWLDCLLYQMQECIFSHLMDTSCHIKMSSVLMKRQEMQAQWMRRIQKQP